MSRTRRRMLLASFAAAIAAPSALFAQSKRAPVLIGWFDSNPSSGLARRQATFKEGFAALGWKEGVQYGIEARSIDGRVEHADAIAAELAARKPAVIVATSLRAAAIAMKAAPTTPVVQTGGSDPVAVGLAESLARPGKMLTGLTSMTVDLSGKFFEFLIAAAPKARRVAVLLDRGALNLPWQRRTILSAAARHPIDARLVEVGKPDEIESALAAAAKHGAQALVIVPSVMLGLENRRILKAAAGHGWPVIAGTRLWAEGGALVSYGDDRSYNYRRAAYYVDRILKGTPPGELPIEQPRKFELVINLKTAKALGLTIPEELLLRADKVIE